MFVKNKNKMFTNTFELAHKNCLSKYHLDQNGTQK